MTVYERLDDDGSVVERVRPLDGSFEDTRLGLAALEGAGGWRVAGPAVPAPSAEPDPPPAEEHTAPEPAAEQDVEQRPRGGRRGTQPNR